jgi:hypothetical protein
MGNRDRRGDGARPPAPASLKRLLALLGAALLLAGLWAGAAGAAEKAVPPTSAERAGEVVATLTDYRAKLEALLPLYEQELARAAEQREQRRELLGRGIISRKEFEGTEAAVLRARGKIEETRRSLAEVDHALVEATSARAIAAATPLGRGGYERTATLIRYHGPSPWSLKTGAADLEVFYLTRFGRALPVTAYGQTPLHDRMGLDHRDALDIGVHPDSPEGRALMEHLRAAGIPFIAAWGVIPGQTSGAHIHVGQPSPRIAVTR